MTCAADDCANQLSGRQRKYCSARCRNRQTARNSRALEAQAKNAAANAPTRIRSGDAYADIAELGLYQLWVEGDLTYEGVKDVIADRVGREYHASTIISALQAARVEARLEGRDDGWEMDDQLRTWLYLDSAPLDDPEALEVWLDEATQGFMEFEKAFFRTPRGPYIRKEFHWKWIKETLRAILTGGKLMILSPPRHGKSELLVHFCVWLIVRDPDIRIAWVGGNGDIAGDMVSAVRDHLENNKQLIDRSLPPSKTYAPRKRSAGREWQQKKFTVACREAVGTKAPTMVAIGRAGKILSRDIDFLIADDIEDFDSTEQPATRAKTRTWYFTQLDSRVEEHTAWVTIGSRQHTDDLYAYLLDDDTWESIVDRAHAADCRYDPNNVSLHTSCMLFPEIRTYRWLNDKRTSAMTMGQEALFEMVYLNDPQPEGSVFWTREIVEPALNSSRGLGIPDNTRMRLVGGLDPAATRNQAAFLWGLDLASDNLTEYMIDLDNRVGGGVDPFLTVANLWLAKYQLRHWVIEVNLFRTGFLNDQRVQDWSAQHQVVIEPHETQDNKHDPWFGVGAMRRKYDVPPIVDLPYGTSEARAKTELYISQMLRFTDDTQKLRKRQTDVLMASWFPQMVLRRWRSEHTATIQDEGYAPSYSGWDNTDYDRESLWS